MSNKPQPESRMKRNPSAAAAAPAMRRQPSKYIPPAVQQQVSDLDNWEQRRKKEEMKRRERLAGEGKAPAAAVKEVAKQPKAQPVVKKLPLSKFAVGPIPQMKRPSNPSRNVR